MSFKNWYKSEEIFLSLTSDDFSEKKFVEIKTKVDRNLLKKMTDGSDTAVESANDFFIRVATRSEAIISWPKMWKLNVLDPKEPEITIIGAESEVFLAQNMIMDVLDPNRNKVLLKIDVSFADHSFIIGKKGKGIQSIMDSTQTHIHFPDENLVNSKVKSNVVVITSDSLRKADDARQAIRHSLPMTISFEVMTNTEKVGLLNRDHQMIQFYQRKYCVVISFDCIKWIGLDTITARVSIRGSRLKFSKVMDSIISLYTLFNSTLLGFNTQVFTMSTEIAARHHLFVTGTNNSNIKTISKQTGAVITFPDIKSVFTEGNETSSFTIKGIGIESTIMAWLQLLDYLPVLLQFNLKTEEIDTQLISSLTFNQSLTMKIHPKGDKQTTTLHLKVEERNMSALFEARKQILGINEEQTEICGDLSSILAQWQHNYQQMTSMSNITPDILSEIEVFRSVNKLDF